MNDGDGKVVYPGKFKQLADKVKDRLGIRHEPVMYLDSHALMRAFMQSDVWASFTRMYPEHDMMRWQFEVKDGEMLGVTLTQFKKDEA